MTGEIVKVLSTDTAAAAGTWTLEEAAWSATRGYPAAVTFHEGRLVFTATQAQPQTIWGSASGDFENFGVGTAAGDSYEFSIAANQGEHRTLAVAVAGACSSGPKAANSA